MSAGVGISSPPGQTSLTFLTPRHSQEPWGSRRKEELSPKPLVDLIKPVSLRADTDLHIPVCLSPLPGRDEVHGPQLAAALCRVGLVPLPKGLPPQSESENTCLSLGNPMEQESVEPSDLLGHCVCPLPDQSSGRGQRPVDAGRAAGWRKTLSHVGQPRPVQASSVLPTLPREGAPT